MICVHIFCIFRCSDGVCQSDGIWESCGEYKKWVEKRMKVKKLNDYKHEHKWVLYDPPHWRHCTICGLEEAKSSPSSEWEKVRINLSLIENKILLD